MFKIESKHYHETFLSDNYIENNLKTHERFMTFERECQYSCMTRKEN